MQREGTRREGHWRRRTENKVHEVGESERRQGVQRIRLGGGDQANPEESLPLGQRVGKMRWAR